MSSTAGAGAFSPGLAPPGRGPEHRVRYRDVLQLTAKLVLVGLGVWAHIEFVFTDVFLEPYDEARYVAAAEVPTVSAARGRDVFEANGCYACHSTDGSELIGPSLQGVWGSEQLLVDGREILVDEDYIAESVLYPQAKVVRGYDAQMPSYEGIVNDEELAALADYIRSLD